jgi:exonuclease VII large subunit
VFTEALCLADKDTEDLAEAFSTLVKRAMQARQNQLLSWRSETVAQAQISLRNYQLDRLTTRFSQIFVRLLEDAEVKDPTSDIRYKSYFVESLSRLIGRGLETQIPKCKDWPIRLAKEPEKALQEFGPLFESALAEGQSALDSLTRASGERKTQRLQEIVGLFEDANNQRKLTANELSTREIERKLGSNWSENFFRKESSAESDPLDLKQRAILSMLAARGFSISKEERAKVVGAEDLVTIDRWCARVGVVATVAELFAIAE